VRTPQLHAPGRSLAATVGAALALALALCLGSTVGHGGIKVHAATAPISALSVSGSPFAASIAPLPEAVTVRLTLPARARTKLLVTKPNGTVVARLIARQYLGAGTYVRTWSGRNSGGTTAPDGEYLVKAVATANGTTQTLVRRIRKGLPAIYAVNPGALVVAVDPGHGGRFPGAVSGGYLEKDFNLDIALKVRQLLLHSGVQVVMTRTTDVAVLEPAADRNGDGRLDRYDDDLMRNDVKNIARADVAVHVHNNASAQPSSHGTGAYVDPDQTWRPEATRLATFLADAEFTGLTPYTAPAFAPKANGVRFGWYYYMGPYDPPYLPRQSLVTSALSESLFLSNPAELEMLKRDDVRTSLAGSIYIGLARWLNSRDLGIGYELVSGPSSPVTAGSSVSYRVKVTNRGNQPSAGWTLQLHDVPAVAEYDGSGQLGSPMGSVAVPDGLAPGASVELVVNATAPASAGSWLVKSNVRLADSSYASDHGVVVLQTALTTISP
jgi:N-acetylmuramoyl-L-alanine amidase